MRLQLSRGPGLQSSEDLSEAGSSASSIVPSHGCWQEASVPHRAGHSRGLACVSL